MEASGPSGDYWINRLIYMIDRKKNVKRREASDKYIKYYL